MPTRRASSTPGSPTSSSPPASSRASIRSDAAGRPLMAVDAAGTLLRLTVNDAERLVALRSADRSLLSVLRDDLGLTGTKEGCGIGVCGACTVIVDGEMVSSCMPLAALVGGAAVRTVGGLGGSGVDPVQQRFVDYGGRPSG